MCNYSYNAQSAPTNIYLYADVGTNCIAQPNGDFQFNTWVEHPLTNRNSSIPLQSSGNLTLNRYGAFTANFIQAIQKYGSTISALTLIIFLIATTVFTAVPSISSAVVRSPLLKNVKHLPVLVVLDRRDLMQIDATVIAGVLILLSLQRFSQYAITEITANIVFPFALVLCPLSIMINSRQD